MKYPDDFINKIICGDALEVLKTLPDETIQMSMSSPPYYGLRDYKVDKQIGLEKTPQEYLQKLWAIYDEIKRVLKKDGVIFVNLGDTYGGSSQRYLEKYGHTLTSKPPTAYLQPKCLLQIPEKFSLGMVERGWFLRNRICWFKRNAMPSSVKDRFTCCWEYVYFFSKSRRYYFDLDSIRIPHKQVSKERVLRAVSNKHKYINNKNYGGGEGINKPRLNIKDKGLIEIKNLHGQCDEQGRIIQVGLRTKIPIDTAELYGSPRARYHRKQNMAISQYQYDEGDYSVVNLNEKGRNPGDHWDITTKGYKEAHFAVYPEKLCEMPVKAGSRSGDIVLDPFAGAGTTCLVAKKLQRNYIGIDLNPDYCQMARDRIEKECGNLF